MRPSQRLRPISRRQFVGTVARTTLGATLARSGRALSAPEPNDANARKKVCLIATEVRKYSHAQHFIDRLLEGYGWAGAYHYPPLELVSLYIDQFPPGDLSRERASRHGVRIYPSIHEALTRGGARLAVDGVLIIGEHGQYPKNEKGQTLYPRYRFFKETVRAFEESGRSVPVFNDKHLSTRWQECVEMVEESKRWQFPFLAGSSLPVTWRIPTLEPVLDVALEESVCVCYGGVDSYDFHGLETAQCMSERRLGGETGVRSVQALKGEKVWALLREQETTRRLVFAALARSHTCAVPPGYTCLPPSLAWMEQAAPGAIAYCYEHLDAFRTTIFLLNGLVQDFTYAGLLKGTGGVISCQMYLPMPPAHTTLANFFNPLMHHIEETFLSGAATYPVERTLLTSGMTLFAVESLFRGGERLQTPELRVNYRGPKQSNFAQL